MVRARKKMEIIFIEREIFLFYLHPQMACRQQLHTKCHAISTRSYFKRLLERFPRILQALIALKAPFFLTINCNMEDSNKWWRNETKVLGGKALIESFLTLYFGLFYTHFRSHLIESFFLPFIPLLAFHHPLPRRWFDTETFFLKIFHTAFAEKSDEIGKRI